MHIETYLSFNFFFLFPILSGPFFVYKKKAFFFSGALSREGFVFHFIFIFGDFVVP